MDATTEIGYAVTSTSMWAPDDELEETPELRWPTSVGTYDRMRRTDAQVISVLRAIMLPIERTAWRIDAGGASDEVVQFIADNLGLPIVGAKEAPQARLRDRFSWEEHLHHALLMLPFGHSFFEQVYRPRPDGLLDLRKLAWRPPKTISRIDVAADGGLIAIEQHGSNQGKPARIPVDRLVAYVNEREGGNWLGKSLLRPAYKDWVLKDRLLRVQVQTVDRNGMGVPVYETSPPPTGLTAEEHSKWQADELKSGMQIARRIRSGNDAGAAIPHGAKLTVNGVSGALPDAMAPIRYYDDQIARAVLAHFLTLGGDQSTGSYALGGTFADFFTLSLQAVAGHIAKTATQHIVEDLVDLNFGPDVLAPRVTFDEIGSRNAPTAQAIAQLVAMGVITADEKLEDFMRTVYGLPPVDPATARTTETAAEPGAPAQPDANAFLRRARGGARESILRDLTDPFTGDNSQEDT